MGLVLRRELVSELGRSVVHQHTLRQQVLAAVLLHRTLPGRAGQARVTLGPSAVAGEHAPRRCL